MVSSSRSGRPVRGRWAPTPSGFLHVGNARTALITWLSIRKQKGTLIWRLEDLDGPRTLPGASEAGIEDLQWLGLDWDEGGGYPGPHEPYVQSQRSSLYEDALRKLAGSERLFPCRLSRSDLKNLARAPHGHQGSGLPPYPATLRPRQLSSSWFEDLMAESGSDAALRFRVGDEAMTFDDRVFGPLTERVDQTVGDFVLKRRDGLYAYQLAVVVDDLAMDVHEVVRGRDLLDSTARQIQLIEALSGSPPVWAHLPLVLNEDGEKLSKRDQGLTLRSLRAAGVSAKNLVGYLAHSVGLLESCRPCSPQELVESFAWERLHREDWTLPTDLASKLT